jgi:hypothetical protein
LTSLRRYYGFQFTPPEGGWKVEEIQQLLADRRPFRAHAFDLACAQLGMTIGSRSSIIHGRTAKSNG